VKKLLFGALTLATGLIVTITGTWLLGAEPLRPDSARLLPHHLAPPGQTGRTHTRAATAADQVDVERSKVRPMLTAELAAVQRASAARQARSAIHDPRPLLVRLCHRYQHVAAFGAHGADLVVRNDNYGGRSECLANTNRWANFAVSTSAARRTGSEPAAFPNIFYGCSWGVCSRGTGLPRRLSRLHHPKTSWYTRGRPPGRWDVAYDIWFARKRHTSGQDRGAEIMLWLRSKGLGRPSGHGLLIERHRWQLEHWLTTNPTSGAHWPLIIFRMVRPHGFVNHLDLMPFFRRAEALGLLHRSWWLTAVEAGFEVWRGGAGLRTTSFWVHL
jgi:hypothetical protein